MELQDGEKGGKNICNDVKVSKETLAKWKHYVKIPNEKTGSVDKGDWKWTVSVSVNS